ncbi:MAG TPA: LLM class flavin-dependent oxidoreductase [Trebonia sp.]|nr:LLM class flavin-dependent oxidoreductase [Trebonia sp.]
MSRCSPGRCGSPSSPTSWGFDSLWAVEHHFDGYAMCPDNVVFLANIAGRTERIKLGTGIVNTASMAAVIGLPGSAAYCYGSCSSLWS